MRYHDCESGERGEILTDERGTYCEECGFEFELRPTFQIEDVEAFAALDEPGAEPLVSSEGGAVIPVDGFALVYGDGGAGKTTLCIDWAVHFAGGSAWLGMLEPARPLRVLVVENEGPRPEFRRKLRRRLDAWSELEGELGASLDGRLRVLSEPWGILTFRNESHREAFADLLADVDLVVAGPLSGLGTEGGGTLDEVREFTQFMRSVRELASSPIAFLLVHHENKAGSVSGAWEGATDTTAHVQALGHGRTRVYWQKVRWCSSLHATSSQLVWADGDTFAIEEGEEITAESMADGILEAARLLPGGSWTKIRELKQDGQNVVRGNATDAASVRDRLLGEGLLVNTATREGRFSLWVADDPALSRSELRTDVERVRSTTPERDTESIRSTVLPLRGTVDRTERIGRPGSDPMGTPPLAVQSSLVTVNGHCTRHVDEPKPWCLECKASAT